MYYPYLRAKQYEMLALRDYIQYNPDDKNIFPILEPVKSTFNSVRLLLKAYKDETKPIGIILNPEVGDMVGKRIQIEEELKDFKDVYTPVFIVNQLNISKIKQHIQTTLYTDVIILSPSIIPGSGDELCELVKCASVSTLIIKGPTRSIRRQIQKMQKKIVILHDCFTKQEKNSDYNDIDEEMFSEEYWFYGDEGYNGIADYTVLPSVYVEGGRLPYAIAIHLTYAKKEQVLIRHFVSDSNDDTSNIQGKFEEAASKAVAFCNSNHLSSSGVNQLKNAFETQHYPGLGALKKISILHHLELISSILES